MQNLGALLPGIKYNHRVYPQELLDGGGRGPMVKKDGHYWFVDGDLSTGGSGTSWQDGFSLIQDAIDASSAFDVIYVQPKLITDFTGDPSSYEENLTIPAGKNHLAIIGISRGRTQGGLPQLKDGSTTTQEILRIRSNGCLIQNLGFNGAGNTGGGILLDDDYSTKSAFATTIDGCHFKNCKGSTATDSRTGGAIMWGSEGNAWQCNITNNLFYKNVGDIVLKGTTNTRPQDILIRGNEFKSSVTSATDCNIYGASGGFQTITIDDNIFGDLPALGSGSIVRYIDLTGTLGGMMTRNMFGAMVAEGGTEITFEASGTGGKIPTTVFMAGNFGQFITGVGAGLVSGEIYA